MAKTGIKAKYQGRYQPLTLNAKLLVKQKKKHEENIRTSLKTHGKEVTKELKKVITTATGSGRHYPGMPKRSSAPGQAPVSQSGRLAQLFLYRTAPYYLKIANDAKNQGSPYPTFLEEGTSKMKARPYFQVTIEAQQYKLIKDLQNLEE